MVKTQNSSFKHVHHVQDLWETSLEKVVKRREKSDDSCKPGNVRISQVMYGSARLCTNQSGDVRISQVMYNSTRCCTDQPGNVRISDN